MYACSPEIKVLGNALKSQTNSFLVKKKVIILLRLTLRIIKLYYFPCNIIITSSKI